MTCLLLWEAEPLRKQPSGLFLGEEAVTAAPPHTERFYMTTIEDFTSQYGLVQKIDAFGYMKYLAENPDAPRKHG